MSEETLTDNGLSTSPGQASNGETSRTRRDSLRTRHASGRNDDCLPEKKTMRVSLSGTSSSESSHVMQNQLNLSDSQEMELSNNSVDGIAANGSAEVKHRGRKKKSNVTAGIKAQMGMIPTALTSSGGKLNDSCSMEQPAIFHQSPTYAVNTSILKAGKADSVDINENEGGRGSRRNKSTSASVLLGLVKSRFKHLKDEKDTPTKGLCSESAGDLSLKHAASSTSTETILPQTSASFPVIPVPCGDVNPMWLKPFELGWTREVVKRGFQQGGGKAACDVYYYAPGGKKLRSMPDIIAFLQKSGDTLPAECFTLRKHLIYHEPYEVFREARPCATKASTSLTSSPSTSLALAIAEVKNDLKQKRPGSGISGSNAESEVKPESTSSPAVQVDSPFLSTDLKQKKPGSGVPGRKRKRDSIDITGGEHTTSAAKKMKSEVKKTKNCDSKAGELSADAALVMSDLQELNRELEAERDRAETLASSTGVHWFKPDKTGSSGDASTSTSGSLIKSDKTGHRASRKASSSQAGQIEIKQEGDDVYLVEDSANLTEQSGRGVVRARDMPKKAGVRAKKGSTSKQSGVRSMVKEIYTDKKLEASFTEDGMNLFGSLVNSNPDISNEMKDEQKLITDGSVTVGGLDSNKLPSDVDKLQVVRAAASQAMKAYMNKALNPGRGAAAGHADTGLPAATGLAVSSSSKPSDVPEVAAFLNVDKITTASSDLGVDVSFVDKPISGAGKSLAHGLTEKPKRGRRRRCDKDMNISTGLGEDFLLIDKPISGQSDVNSIETKKTDNIDNSILGVEGKSEIDSIPFSGICSTSIAENQIQIKTKRYGVTRNVVASKVSPKSSSSTKVKYEKPVTEKVPDRKRRKRKDQSEQEIVIDLEKDEPSEIKSAEPIYATDLDIVAAIAAGSYPFKNNSNEPKKPDSTLVTSSAVNQSDGIKPAKTGKKRGRRPSLEAASEVGAMNSSDVKTSKDMQRALTKGFLKVIMPRLPAGLQSAKSKTQSGEIDVDSEVGQQNSNVTKSGAVKSTEGTQKSGAKIGSTKSTEGALKSGVSTPKIGSTKSAEGVLKSGASTPKSGPVILSKSGASTSKGGVEGSKPPPVLKVTTAGGGVEIVDGSSLNQCIIQKWSNKTCGLDCTGRLGIPPSFYCDTCMSAYHPECVGMRHSSYKISYTCLNCRTMKKESENLVYTLNNYKPISDNSHTDTVNGSKPSDANNLKTSTGVMKINDSNSENKSVGTSKESTGRDSSSGNGNVDGDVGENTGTDSNIAKDKSTDLNGSVSARETSSASSLSTENDKTDKTGSGNGNDKVASESDKLSKNKRSEREIDTDPRPHSERLMSGTVLTIPAMIIEAVQGQSKPFEMMVAGKSLKISPDMVTRTGTDFRIVLPVDMLPEAYTRGARAPLLYKLEESKEKTGDLFISVTLAKDCVSG